MPTRAVQATLTGKSNPHEKHLYAVYAGDKSGPRARKVWTVIASLQGARGEEEQQGEETPGYILTYLSIYFVI